MGQGEKTDRQTENEGQAWDREKETNCAFADAGHLQTRMHSSGLLPVCPSMHCFRGVYLTGGVPALGGCVPAKGVYLPRECTCLGGYLPRWGCICPGGVLTQDVYLPSGVYLSGGVYLPGKCTCPDTPPCEQTDTCKNITFANFVGSNNRVLLSGHLHRASVSTVRQLCDDAGNTVLIENNGAALKCFATLFCSDCIVFLRRTVSLALSQR